MTVERLAEDKRRLLDELEVAWKNPGHKEE